MNFAGKKGFSTGVADFAAILNDNSIFVDKTFFLERIIDNVKTRQVCLFTRPRRFGKSLTLDMVKTFFATENAAANRPLFDGLQIEQAGSRYMAEQGQYPVLSLSFADTKPLDYDDFKLEIAAYLREVCERYSYLLKSEELSDTEKILLRQWCTPGTKLVEYKRMLGTLSRWLQQAHPQKHPVILLIDEYDTPINVAYHHGYHPEAIVFFRDFLCNGLKINPCLKFALLTGILKITKESIFSGLNNFQADTIFDDKYADVFGFTQAEMDQLLEYYECQDKKAEVEDWYDGYSFGTQRIYNPWSVLNYLGENCKATDYWINTSDSDPILQVCAKLYTEEDRADLERLLLGYTLKGEAINTDVTYGDGLRERDAALGYLLMAGYLKATPSKNRDECYDVSVPNNEVRKAFKREIISRLRVDYRFNDKMLRDLPTAIITGDRARFQELLQDYIRKVCSCHDDTSSADQKKGRPESFYHGVVVGLSAIMSDYYEVKSNFESGRGRSDLLLLPRTGKKGVPETLPIIIMEFKKASPSDSLPEKAKLALAQIHERQYGADLEADCPRLCYGLAFRSKEVAIAEEYIA